MRLNSRFRSTPTAGAKRMFNTTVVTMGTNSTTQTHKESRVNASGLGT